ncbi:hypothetical protein T8T21_15180 [Limimaricola variabilis]|uniref:hypothetical protein n=1 Tax=Limimaricola variabilis TaxID=1492771 RepID=UPI002AC9846E|nr:hypothetical protein [Limimaricola variabilis]WPY94428.1 hypothetical protein T8T21_15180 [Limimaricola variabilis]
MPLLVGPAALQLGQRNDLPQPKLPCHIGGDAKPIGDAMAGVMIAAVQTGVRGAGQLGLLFGLPGDRANIAFVEARRHASGGRLHEALYIADIHLVAEADTEQMQPSIACAFRHPAAIVFGDPLEILLDLLEPLRRSKAPRH